MIKPLGDRVVVEVAEVELKTKSGIIMPETSKEKTTAPAPLWKSKLTTKLFLTNTRAVKSKWTTKIIS